MEFHKAGFLASEMQKAGHSGYLFSPDCEGVPSKCGYFSVYDGLQLKSAGVTWNMRKSVEESVIRRKFDCLIIFYKPDLDGSAEEWLRGVGF